MTQEKRFSKHNGNYLSGIQNKNERKKFYENTDKRYNRFSKGFNKNGHKFSHKTGYSSPSQIKNPTKSNLSEKSRGNQMPYKDNKPTRRIL